MEETTTTPLTIGTLHSIVLERARHHKGATRSPKTIIYPGERIRRGKVKPPCQIGIEITDYTGDKISVGVARPSHILGQSVPCDR